MSSSSLSSPSASGPSGLSTNKNGEEVTTEGADNLSQELSKIDSDFLFGEDAVSLQEIPYSKYEGLVSITTEYNEQLAEHFSLLNLLNVNDPHKNQYWANLKKNSLYISEKSGEVKIDLDGASVRHYPLDLLDNEIWLPRFPIQISHSTRKLWKDSNVIYIYSKLAIDKETWFLSLKYASICQSEARRKEYHQRFQSQIKANIKLLRDFQVMSIPESDRWFNLIFGRLFWSPNYKNGLKEFFHRKLNQKMQRKLSRKGSPSFLQDVHCEDIYVGEHFPLLSKARILSLNNDGSMVADADLEYCGGFSATVRATLVVDLFLQRRYRLALKVSIGTGSGKVQLQIKAPPTSCFWVGFYEPPTVEIIVEPIVQDFNLKFSKVKQIIEKLIRDAIDDTMVLPNMDDYPLPYINEIMGSMEKIGAPFERESVEEMATNNGNNDNNSTATDGGGSGVFRPRSRSYVSPTDRKSVV